MRAGVIFTIVALAAVAAGAWWALGSRPVPGAPERAAVPPESASGGVAGGPAVPVTRRDPARDRDLTASADAFQQYAEGVARWGHHPLEATVHLRNATRLDPGFAPAHYRLAWTALLLSADGAGVASIRAALDAGERLPEPYRTAALPLSRFLDGSFDLASTALGDALQAQPGDADLRLLAGLLAGCSCDHFDPEEAVSHLEAALAAAPRITAARAMLADLQGSLGRPAPAVERARARLKEAPGDPEAHAEMGRAQIWAGAPSEALAQADEVLRAGGDPLALGLGSAFVLQGEHRELRALDDSEMEPGRSVEGNIRAHLAGGINDVWGGRFAEAARRFERGAEYARAPWRRAEAARFFMLLGRVRSLAGRHAEAGAALQAAQRMAGNQPLLAYLLGLSALEAGQPEEAARAARRLGHEMRRERPGWTEPWRLLLEGELALARGDAVAAAPLVADAWRLASARPQDCVGVTVEAYFLDAVGRVALASGRPQEALEAYDRIGSLGARALHQPEIVVLSLHRAGLALEALGRGAEAAERYRRFLALWGEADAPPEETNDAASRLARLPS